MDNKHEVILQEFQRITGLGGKYLTTHGYNELAKFSSVSVIKTLKMSWKELLEKHGLIEKLKKYAVDEYLKFAYKVGKADSTKFVKEHKYLRQYLFSTVLDIKEIRREGGFINEFYSGMYNDFLLKKNFQRIKERIGVIPSITQFIKESDILASIYCDYYGIKGQQWDEVLKTMVEDKKELEQFFEIRKNDYKEKSITALKKGWKKHFTDEELEIEFRRVFDMYIEKFGTHPTRRIFNEESVFNDNTYRKRYKMRWREIAIEKYGYELKERNVSEKIFLESVKEILKTTYKRGQTFSWLHGISGKHLFYDGYFETYNLVVEFDGKHHRVPVPNFGGYERFLKDQQNDRLKEKLIKEHKINFLRVSSKERWRDIEYLKSRLEQTLNIELNICNE